MQNSKRGEHQHVCGAASVQRRQRDAVTRLRRPDAKRLRIPHICPMAAQTRKVSKSTAEPELNRHEGAAEASRFQCRVLLDCKLL